MQAKRKLVVIGAHGSGEIAMSLFSEVFSTSNDWEILGYINDVAAIGEQYAGYDVIGETKDIQACLARDENIYIHYTLHFNAKKKRERVRLFRSLQIEQERHVSGIHPRAFLNPTSAVGLGSLILPNAATSANSKIGNFVHVYTNAFIGHDSTISDYCTIAAHSVIGARVFVGEGAHIGLNACIREDCNIGEYSIVGMGAVVINDIPNNAIVAGNPARVIGQIES
jgi:acetyltransferase EpsM